LFISHNLGLILETCDKITVMYSGEAVETGKVHEVFDRMRHPYTQGLFNSIPLPGADKNSRPLIAIPGQLPLPHQRPFGCNFGPRCPHFDEEKCNSKVVRMTPVKGNPDHKSRCSRIEEIDWFAEPERPVVAEATPVGDVVLKVDELKKYYDVAANTMFGGDTRTVKANETISFYAREAETVAIVGESGCGKSTLAKVLLGLETKTAGEVKLGNLEIGDVEVGDRETDTVASVQMVFQNPFDTLNPSHSVGGQIIRTLEKFKIGNSQADRRQRMLELLDLVKLPRAFADRMPRQLSGGQKQRIGVARAFAGQPKVVVADEPVSALDVSVQAAVTELLMEIQREAKTTMLFISHDLSVVRYIADRVVVMYLGHIVEQGDTDTIFSPPYHPYTEALLSAIPIADTSVQKKHIVLDGDIPSALNPPSGCPFQTRCPRKMQVEGDLCEREVPPMRKLGNGHEVKCHLSQEVLDSMEPVIVLGEKKTSDKKVATKTTPKKSPAKQKTVATAAAVVASAATVVATSSKKKSVPSVKSKAKLSTAKAAPRSAAAKAKDARPSKMKKPVKPDDLKLISGIGPKLEGVLNGLGIYKFEQISKWKKAERDWVDGYLNFKGRIDRDNWVSQAKKLSKKK